jgi:dTDP-4-dehydrorhamnose reductase
MIAIIGSNGQLGWELVRRAEHRGYKALALDLPELDITQPASIKGNLSSKKLSLVINAAAYTEVDQAESEADQVED